MNPHYAPELEEPADVGDLFEQRQGVDPSTFPDPEDQGRAERSAIGTVEYVDNLIRPGRITLVAAEEGSGKTYAIDDELAIRVAVAGGSFAGTWPVVAQGAVLVLSEMHRDDDLEYQDTVLASLDVERSALTGRYFRLGLMTAAGGAPALTVAAWRDWITAWMRERGVILLVVDTATGATQVDPWGKAIQAVYRDLRGMLEAYPELAVALLVHLRKPTGRGDRRISDVLGEWGRWCDVILMMETDGATRTKLSTHKRVKVQRRVTATKSNGLLVDPIAADAPAGPKVPLEEVVAAVAANPGLSYADLGAAIGVSKDTASNYVKAASGRFTVLRSGPRGASRVFPAAESTAEPPNTAEHARFGAESAVHTTDVRTTAEPPNHIYRFGGRSSVVARDPDFEPEFPDLPLIEPLGGTEVEGPAAEPSVLDLWAAAPVNGSPPVAGIPGQVPEPESYL